MTNVQKFTYLKAQLIGEAADAIAGLPITENAYKEACTILKSRFGQPHVVTKAYMRAVIDLEKPLYTYICLRKFSDKLGSYMRTLRTYGKDDDYFGGILVPIVMDKLPSEVQRNLARKYGDREYSLSEVISGLENEVFVMGAGYQPGTKPEEISTMVVGSAGIRCQIGPLKCHYCSAGHKATNCIQFVTVEARKNRIKQLGLCFNCLISSHQSRQCPSRIKCKKCHVGRHHTSICTGSQSRGQAQTGGQGSSSDLAGVQNPRVPDSSLQNGQGQGQSQSQVSAAVHDNADSSQVDVIQNIDAPTVSRNVAVAVSGNYYDGSQRSFIQDSLAEELQLVTEREDLLQLASFGSQSASDVRLLPVVKLRLICRGEEVFEMELLVVPEIAAPIKNMSKITKEFSHLENLTLAHPVDDTDLFNITVLIGSDYYYNIVDDIMR
ncbi:uncharacterized protein LOC141907380 [Tubulanus polymorphus]|uniref:uncharacterized protein LOC141907380 n=1 Tax=Tubulanus polymorphus TaxID=672921 RepID=UPI003DA35AB0